MDRKTLFVPLFCGGLLMLTTTGCSLFDNSTPPEDATGTTPAAVDFPEDMDLGTGDLNLGTGNGSDLGNPEIPSNTWGNATEEGIPGNEDLTLVSEITLPTIYFDYDRDALNPTETVKLDAVYEYMGQYPELYIVVEGHCDDRGTNEYNRALCERRAISVKNYLSGKGMNPEQIRTISYGEDKPAVQGTDEQSRQLNRRGVLLAAKKRQ